MRASAQRPARQVEGEAERRERARDRGRMMREVVDHRAVELSLAVEEVVRNTEPARDLPRIFAAELGDVLNVVARRVVIEIDFPAGVRPLHFVGRDGLDRLRKVGAGMLQFWSDWPDLPPGRVLLHCLSVRFEPGSAGRQVTVPTARLAQGLAAVPLLAERLGMRPFVKVGRLFSAAATIWKLK